jgi:sulfopyruvate decarboxylase subunit alpha
MGEIMTPLLDLMKIPHRLLSAEEPMSAPVLWARAELDATRKPVALLAPGGVLE